VLPNVTVLGDGEKHALRAFIAQGGRLVVTGSDATGLSESTKITRLASDPTGAYFAALEKDFEAGSSNPPAEFLNAARVNAEIEVDAPKAVGANFGLVKGTPHVFLANFGGLVPNKVAIPTPAKGIQVRVPLKMGDTASYLPFLGEAQALKGTRMGDKVEFELPAVERGAVVWFKGKH
jgi:hypothetical protein